MSPEFVVLKSRRFLVLATLGIALMSGLATRAYYRMEVHNRERLIHRTGEQTLGNVETLVTDQIALYELELLDQLSRSHEEASGIRYFAVVDRDGHPLHDYRPASVLDSLRRGGPWVRLERPLRTSDGRGATLVLGLDPRVFHQGLPQTLSVGVMLSIFSTVLGAGLLALGRRTRLNALAHAHEIERERKAKDVAEGMSREKSAFLANVSHEIRTPMNGIIGTVELLDHSGLDSTQRTLLQDLDTSATNLVTLLDKVLDAARIDSGQFVIEEVDFPPQQLSDNIAAIFGAKARQKSLSLKVELDPDLPDAVRGDAVRLQQVLNNLVGNALKFTKGGWIRVDLAHCGTVGDQVLVEFRVRDTGMGIPVEALPTIFEPFTQADGTSRRHFGGTGLGLSICRNIVEMMGGTIHGRNREGGGAEFAFHVPLGRARTPRKAPTPAEASRPNRHGGAASRVLLVEDNPINQRMMVRMLEKLGHRPVVARNGREGVEIFAADRFDLVFMDCQMPEMDGYAATAEIRRREGGRVHTPIIATTANAMPGDREKCLKAGMDDFLAKPVRRESLEATLDRWLTARTPA